MILNNDDLSSGSSNDVSNGPSSQFSPDPQSGPNSGLPPGEPTRVWIAIGSNVGDRLQFLKFGLSMTAKLPLVRVLGTSPVYETAPVGPVSQGTFLNAVFEVQTSLRPAALLDELQAIEVAAGRLPVGQRVHWGPRELDLDILLYGDEKVDDERLHLPHPRMQDRWFVMRPLADAAPALIHPTLGVTMSELAGKLESDGQPAPGTRFCDGIEY